MLNQLPRTNSLVDHYRICYNTINTPNIDTQMLAWIFVYIRLFSIKDLKKDMNSLYQTKDISHIQSELSMSLTKVFVDTFSCNDRDTSLDRALIRNILNFSPRGGGNGDELRLFILDLMRRNGIREGHRPGIDDPFIEAWHQKLHSCCTPEDIGICEAYIVFQETNSHDMFYKTLWEKSGISVDFLQNMPCPIRHSPRYMPQLIPDLKHLLWILKQIHGGSHNFQYLLEVSKWQLDNELYSMLLDVKNNFGAWWIPGKILECRYRLKNILNNNCPRDPLMIDIALDNIYKSSTEKIDLRTLSGDDIISLIHLSLQNIYLSYNNEKISLCIDLWNRIKDAQGEDKWSCDWALKAFAALSYIQSIIHSYTDELYEEIQPKAQLLGESCNIPESYIINFAEEVIRSQNTFVLSKLIDALFPMIRNTAQIGSFKIISHGSGSKSGTVKVCDSLLSIQGLQIKKPQIIIVNKIEGIEDIPNWVCAIITTSDVDILSHIAIRSRSSKVILSTCYDQEMFEKLKSFEGRELTLFIENNIVRYHENATGQSKSIVHDKKKKTNSKKSSKSINLTKIEKKLSDFIKTPRSATLPYEAFEQTLESNSKASSKYKKLIQELNSDYKNYSSILSKLRELIYNLDLSNDIIKSIKEKIKICGGNKNQWSKSLENDVLASIKKVWGSVWNERAYLNRLSRKLDNNQVRMGVLIQNVIPADYSFIIHTNNPINNNSNEILSEIVVGLGETLTSNSTGSALCVISNKKTNFHTISSYPSKQIAYFDNNKNTSYIMRSDSNDEDLSDFTGAGLYDSYFVNKITHRLVQYDREKLFWDKEFQIFLFNSLIKIAKEIECIMKCPQDIEGVYANNTFYIVQTRNQTDCC